MVANGVRSFDADQVASLVATLVFYAVFGGVAGWVGRLLRRAEQEVAVARARDEIARTMHDTVLQTLALTARRTARAIRSWPASPGTATGSCASSCTAR